MYDGKVSGGMTDLCSRCSCGVCATGEKERMLTDTYITRRRKMKKRTRRRKRKRGTVEGDSTPPDPHPRHRTHR